MYGILHVVVQRDLFFRFACSSLRCSAHFGKANPTRPLRLVKKKIDADAGIKRHTSNSVVDRQYSKRAREVKTQFQQSFYFFVLTVDRGWGLEKKRRKKRAEHVCSLL